MAGALPEEAARVVLHPERVVEYLTVAYGHDRLSSVVPRAASGPNGPADTADL